MPKDRSSTSTSPILSFNKRQIVERILTKEEIDELLSAISTGEIDTDSTPALHEPDNSVTRLDLIQASKGTDRWQNTNFDIISDTFARNYGISLTNKLERYVTITRESIYSIQFDSFLKKINNNENQPFVFYIIL